MRRAAARRGALRPAPLLHAAAPLRARLAPRCAPVPPLRRACACVQRLTQTRSAPPPSPSLPRRSRRGAPRAAAAALTPELLDAAATHAQALCVPLRLLSPYRFLFSENVSALIAPHLHHARARQRPRNAVSSLLTPPCSRAPRRRLALRRRPPRAAALPPRSPRLKRHLLQRPPSLLSPALPLRLLLLLSRRRAPRRWLQPPPSLPRLRRSLRKPPPLRPRQRPSPPRLRQRPSPPLPLRSPPPSRRWPPKSQAQPQRRPPLRRRRQLSPPPPLRRPHLASLAPPWRPRWLRATRAG